MTKVLEPGLDTFEFEDNLATGVESKKILGWQAKIVENYYLPASRQQETIGQKLYWLLSSWQKDTQYQSSLTEMYLHPAYQHIIGMGNKVIPYLLRELERNPDFYFWALEAITGENPVQLSHMGNLEKMTQDWLTWARTNNYRW